MKLNLKKRLIANVGKVKSIDFHPTFNWVLLGLYNGCISIYDFNTQTSVQYIEVSLFPIRCIRFLPDKNYIICGSDDKMIRIFNYITMEKIKEFEAHNDFIRSIQIHYKQTSFLTCSDDNSIHLYDATNNDFNLIRTYTEHNNFVMNLAVNIKDYDMFASASMDKKIKLWSFSNTNSQLTLEGHVKGCTTVAFCPLTDKPYIASGSDDKCIKIWDYTTKQVIFTLESHEDNITAISFHQELPLLITASEDQTCKFWNINNSILEDTKIFGYGIIWEINSQKDSNVIGIGSDEAILVFQMGNELPMATFSQSQSKIIYCQHNNIFSINLKQIQSNINNYKDGEIISIPPKQLGSSDMFPNKIEYSPNGRYFSLISSNNDLIISTSGVYRSSFVGSAFDFAWNENDSFITKHNNNQVKLYNELKEIKSFKPKHSCDKVYGGYLFAIKHEDSITFYDYENTIMIRTIEVVPVNIIWNDNKSLIALICEDETYILKVNIDLIEKYIESVIEGDVNDDGCENSFEVYYSINDKIINGFFVDDVFIYQASKNKINYALNDKVFPITTLGNKYYLIGYLNTLDRLFLMNKQFQLISFKLPYTFIQYQIAIVNNNITKANTLYNSIPPEYHSKVISFLEKFNLSHISYSLTKDSNLKFSLAIKLHKLEDAWEIAKNENNTEKIKLVADLAIAKGDFALAEQAMQLGNDFSGLLLYYSSIQDRTKLKDLADKAKEYGLFNISFACYFQLNDIDKCVDLLIKAKRYPEASVFCRTYCPSKLNDVISKWNTLLEQEEDINNNNSRMTVRIINPVNESNRNVLSKTEKVIQDLYKEVNKGDMNDMNSYINVLNMDIHNDISSGKQIDIKDILK